MGRADTENAREPYFYALYGLDVHVGHAGTMDKDVFALSRLGDF